MENSHDFLSRKKTIRNQSYDKWRYHGCNRKGAVSCTNLYTGRVQINPHVCIHGNVPGSPDKIFKKHHQGELCESSRLHEKKLIE
jgi:hypothetical protein